MKEIELRIGNITNSGIVRAIHNDYVEMDCYVRFDDGTKLQHEGSDTFIEDELGYDEFDGEPLTEEWLLKFGFEKSKFDYKFEFRDIYFTIKIPAFLNHDRELTLTFHPKMKEWGFTFMGNKIQYVHQLQNLYFALTGTELEIKK